MVANLKELYQALTKSKLDVPGGGLYAKWKAKRHQESPDVVYSVILNYEASDDKSEKENGSVPF